MGKAITKVITVAEILKRRVAGLHQRTSLHTLEMDETFEPKDEGLNVVRRKRRVGAVTVTLCGDISRIDAGAVGYQAPVPEDEVTPKVTARTKPKKKTNEQRGAKTDDEDEAKGLGARKRPKRGKRYGRNLRGRDRTETHGDAASSFVDAGAMSGARALGARLLSSSAVTRQSLACFLANGKRRLHTDGISAGSTGWT